MNRRIESIKQKIKTFLDKALKNKKDMTINSHKRDETQYQKMHENMKTY